MPVLLDLTVGRFYVGLRAERHPRPDEEPTEEPDPLPVGFSPNPDP